MKRDVTIDQQLPGNIGISGSWVFSRALHLPVFTDGNLSQTTATKTYTYPGGSTFTVPFYTAANRLNATGPILVGRSTVNSLYNSFVLNDSQAHPAWGGIHINYTLSKAEDDGQVRRAVRDLQRNRLHSRSLQPKRHVVAFRSGSAPSLFSQRGVAAAVRAALVEQTRQADCERVGAIEHLHRGVGSADHGPDLRYTGWRDRWRPYRRHGEQFGHSALEPTRIRAFRATSTPAPAIGTSIPVSAGSSRLRNATSSLWLGKLSIS